MPVACFALLPLIVRCLPFPMRPLRFLVRLSRTCRRALDPFVAARSPFPVRCLPFAVSLSNPFALSRAAVGRQPALSLPKGRSRTTNPPHLAPATRAQPARPRIPVIPAPTGLQASPGRSQTQPKSAPPRPPSYPRRRVSVRPTRSPQTQPKSAPPRLKSFLEKTLNAHETAYSAPQTPRPAAPPSVPAAPLAKALLALPLIAALLAACDPAPSRELHVFAAASLRQAIADAADAFQAANPGVRVVGSYAGSQVLRLQVESGARADLFVSANPGHLDALQRAGLLREPSTVVAANQLILAVPAGNPAQVTGLHDLTQPNRRVVMAGESVPAGAYARRMLALHAAASGQPGFADAVLRRVISFETNVRQVAAKLELGEADAGFVYRTDVLASDGRLHVVETPPQVLVTARYPAAVLRDAPNPELARRFLAFLRSPEAQAILARRGFGPAA